MMQKIDDTEYVIVDTILAELKDRSGFDNWWYEIDSDIQDEIRETLAQSIKKYLEKEDD